MEDTTHKISICMIVKNEEKNLGRCLDSFKDFLDDPLVELIIVDTGSEDSTVEIAKRYTKNVYFHKWNNNFSDMRNISISYAKGKWVLIVDADEYLENPKEAYHILMERDWENYNTIQLQIKNYIGVNNKENYSILPQPRLFRNDGKFRFEGVVHNQPQFELPMLATNIILEHDGYMQSDAELMERKFQRTVTMLKEELDKDPSNIYYQFQLAVSYSMYDDNETALKEIRKAYRMIKKRPSNEKKAHVYTYGMYTRTALKNNKVEETIEISKEGIRLQPDYVDLYFILGYTLIAKGERSEAIKYFKKYEDLVQNYDKTMVSKNPAFIMYNLDSKSYDIAYINMALYHYDNEEYEKAYQYLQKVKEEPQKHTWLCKTLIKQRNHEDLKQHYDSIEDNDIKNQYVTTLEDELSKLKSDEVNKIAHIFKENDDAYGLFSKIRLAEDSKEDLIKQLFNQYNINDLPMCYAKVLVFFDNKIDRLIPYFKKINNTILAGYVNLLIDESKNMKKDLIEFLLENSSKIRTNDYQTNRVYVKSANVILLKLMEEAKNQNKPLCEQGKKIFNLYLEKGFDCLEYIYDVRKLRMIYSTLAIQEDKFFMIMYLVQDAVEKERFSSGIKYIREALKQFPHMAIALQEYQKEVFKI